MRARAGASAGRKRHPGKPRDPVDAAAALKKCKDSLTLADRIGACCCVNIAGSCRKNCDGPEAADLTEETFDRIVSVVRDIIDTVKPMRSFYTLETMPWIVRGMLRIFIFDLLNQSTYTAIVGFALLSFSK